jgi:hypothetical protein
MVMEMVIEMVMEMVMAGKPTTFCRTVTASINTLGLVLGLGFGLYHSPAHAHGLGLGLGLVGSVGVAPGALRSATTTATSITAAAFSVHNATPAANDAGVVLAAANDDAADSTDSAISTSRLEHARLREGGRDHRERARLPVE